MNLERMVELDIVESEDLTGSANGDILGCWRGWLLSPESKEKRNIRKKYGTLSKENHGNLVALSYKLEHGFEVVVVQLVCLLILCKSKVCVSLPVLRMRPCTMTILLPADSLLEYASQRLWPNFLCSHLPVRITILRLSRSNIPCLGTWLKLSTVNHKKYKTEPIWDSRRWIFRKPSMPQCSGPTLSPELKRDDGEEENLKTENETSVFSGPVFRCFFGFWVRRPKSPRSLTWSHKASKAQLVRPFQDVFFPPDLKRNFDLWNLVGNWTNLCNRSIRFSRTSSNSDHGSITSGRRETRLTKHHKTVAAWNLIYKRPTNSKLSINICSSQTRLRLCLFHISISFANEVNSIPVEGLAKGQSKLHRQETLGELASHGRAIAQKQSFHFEHLCQASSALESAPDRIFILPSKESLGEILWHEDGSHPFSRNSF